MGRSKSAGEKKDGIVGISQDEITALAKEKKFMMRKARKIEPDSFLAALCSLASNGAATFGALAGKLGIGHGVDVSRQAVWKRVKAPCLEFVKAVLACVLTTAAGAPVVIPSGILSTFGRVILADSTTVKLADKFKALFPGSGNQFSTTASMKIQCAVDLLAGAFVHFSMTPFTRNDYAASADVLDYLRAGDLIIRDLGYFSIAVLRSIADAQAFFLSRMRMEALVYDPNSGARIDTRKLFKSRNLVDMPILLGEDERFPVRLIGVPVPAAVADKRRREARKERKEKDGGCPKAETLRLLSWNILVTNVPCSVWSPHSAAFVYRLRWRIEIIFKAWKSFLSLTEAHLAGLIQLLVIMSARMITLASVHSMAIKNAEGLDGAMEAKDLSILKVAKFVAANWSEVAELLASPDGAGKLRGLLTKHCSYDKRKRANYAQELETALNPEVIITSQHLNNKRHIA
jgi:hypothetical protein